MRKKVLTGLKSDVYEHPFDRKALASLEKMPGVPLLMKKVNEYGIDRLLRLRCLGADFRVTSKNFPVLHLSLVEACRVLETPLPELYLCRGMGHIRTITIGVESPIVNVNLETYEWLSPEELVYVMGHEIAHIKSQHMLYHQMALVMPTIKSLINSATLGLGGLAASGMEVAFWNWLMMARFTSDRAGLLACQDVNIAVTTLMKLGGLPNEHLTPVVISEFLNQVEEFTSKELDNPDKLMKLLSFSESNSSWIIVRAAELLKWVNSGEYEAVKTQPNLKILEINQSHTDDQLEKEDREDQLESKDKAENEKDWNFLTNW